MTETPWSPRPEGVLTDNWRDNLRMIRSSSHADESEDVCVRLFRAMGRDAALFCVDGLSSAHLIQRFLLSPLMAAPPPEGDALAEDSVQNALPLVSLTPTAHLSVLLERVFSGDAALIVDGMTGALIADVKGFAKRGLTEPINETVVAGPHEGFSESLRDNAALLRRLLPTPALISERLTVGTKVPVPLCLMYLDGVARKETVDALRSRLTQCGADYVSSLGMLEQLLEDDPFALLPQAAATERPDRAVSFLNEGQAVILMENAPAALAMPAGLFHLVHAPDDTALRWQYGSFLRVIRLCGMLTALLLPAVFVALTVYHPEGMSLPLLTSVVESQAKVPLSLFSSTVLMLLVYNLICEASTRVPGAMGASLSIVGGLILGQAVVEADLFSPLVLIVAAVSGLGSYAAPVFPLTLGIRIAQLLLTLAAGIGGYGGLILALFFLAVRLFSMTSLEHPFLAPLFPRRSRNPDLFLRLPIWRQRLRGYIAFFGHAIRTEGPIREWDPGRKK